MYYFVGGFPRSGTTVMGNLLCGDSRANPPVSEVSYLEYLMFPFEAFSTSWEANYRGLFDDEDEFWEFHKSLLQKFLDHLQDKHQCEHLVVKRPFLTRWFPTLAQMFEDARFVICIRDPRDVIGSLKNVQRKHLQLSPEQRRANPYLEQSLLDFCYAYANCIEICVRAPKEVRDRFLFSKYEDLVTNLESSIEEIGKELGLELGLEEEFWAMYSQAKTSNPFHSKWWGKPITSANIGKYKSQLDSEEIEMVELVCQLIMEGFGYEGVSRKMEGGTRRLRTPQG